MNFKDWHRLRQHKMVEHFTCEKCKKKFKSITAFNQHNNALHSASEIEERDASSVTREEQQMEARELYEEWYSPDGCNTGYEGGDC
jgi:hypothetical protein